LLDKLPQGPGSGLDADMVDGLHAAEIIARAPGKGGGGGGGGGGSGSGDMTKATYDIDENGVVDDSEKLDGKTLAQVQDHDPKAHIQSVSTLTDHDKTEHDALGIDAATLEGKTLAEVTDPAADIRVRNIGGTPTEVGYATGNEAVPVKLQDIDTLLRTLLNTPLARLAVDSAGRLRIIIDVAGVATPVTQSGTFTVGLSSGQTLGTLATHPYGQSWELMQRANIEYDQIQRSRMVIT
jgi:hypothetical protein